jgi:hypothetical protein
VFFLLREFWDERFNVAKAFGLPENELQKILAGCQRDVNLKPKDPKAIMEKALKKSRLPRSSAIYANLASTVTLKNCQDKSFNDFKSALVNWFGNSLNPLGEQSN